MSTPKAIIAGLVITVGLLAASAGLEAVAQLTGDFPEEEETHDLEEEHGEEEEGDAPADDVDLTGDENEDEDGLEEEVEEEEQ